MPPTAAGTEAGKAMQGMYQGLVARRAGPEARKAEAGTTRTAVMEAGIAMATTMAREELRRMIGVTAITTTEEDGLGMGTGTVMDGMVVILMVEIRRTIRVEVIMVMVEEGGTTIMGMGMEVSSPLQLAGGEVRVF